MIQRTTDTVICITANWDVPSHIHAVTTTRIGGISTSPFNSMNLASHVGDDITSVNKNRELLIQQLSLPNEPVWLKQIHGNRILNIDIENNEVPADGSITTQAGKICTVLTADCFPVLLCDQDGKQISAIHVGWRGFTRNIVKTVIEKFKVKPDKILAWIGPGISAEHYEVGVEVKEACVKVSKNAGNAFLKIHDKNWNADLRMLVTTELQTNGVENISIGHYCTYSEPKRFFSYRRDGITGRMASMIWMDS